jgi:DNA-binding response OmpR family regulator
MDRNIRILVVDDEPDILETLEVQPQQAWGFDGRTRPSTASKGWTRPSACRRIS